MARPSWLITDPESNGNGNAAIKNSASEHTGRNARQGTVTVQATGVEQPKTYQVTQLPKDEFISFDNGSEQSAPKTGGTVTITGKSNTSKITISWVGDGKEVELPESYQAAGGSVNNGEAISGDPGATAQYSFQIQLQFPENETIEEVSRVLKVEANDGSSAQITIKQAAGDPTLSIDPAEITIPQLGTPAVNVNVTSNTTWTIS